MSKSGLVACCKTFDQEGKPCKRASRDISWNVSGKDFSGVRRLEMSGWDADHRVERLVKVKSLDAAGNRCDQSAKDGCGSVVGVALDLDNNFEHAGTVVGSSDRLERCACDGSRYSGG